jgi:hypothetical protein
MENLSSAFFSSTIYSGAEVAAMIWIVLKHSTEGTDSEICYWMSCFLSLLKKIVPTVKIGTELKESKPKFVSSYIRKELIGSLILGTNFHKNRATKPIDLVRTKWPGRGLYIDPKSLLALSHFNSRLTSHSLLSLLSEFGLGVICKLWCRLIQQLRANADHWSWSG